MELFSAFWQFLLLWTFLYLFVFLLKLLSTRNPTPRRTTPHSILPTFSIHQQSTELERDQWSIKLFQVKYTTQRLNSFFYRLNNFAPWFWKVWFHVGAIVASITMLVGMVVIVFAGFKIISSLKHLNLTTTSHAKRDLIEPENGDEQVFLPMIPGVTLPMSHIGYYLLALLVCGLFHEAGHAIASFSEGVPIQSSGMFVLYLYPGAFVNIPDQQLQTLAPFRQLKIICAGVWHNLTLYLFTTVSLAGGLKLLLLLLGWQSLEGQGGVSVVHIRTNSPLATHLPPSTVIYQLDDMPLTNNIEDWNSFLFKEDGRHTLDLGFCVSKPLEDYGNACCDVTDENPFGQSTNASISCFQSIEKTVEKQCLPTLSVLATKNIPRCYRASDCNGSDSTCVIPFAPSIAGQVVRIHAQFPSWITNEEVDNKKIFVFEGELVDIWESVKVSILRPRFWVLPTSLPHVLELILRYISSFTIALALLNILPAFKLDGEFALEQLLISFLKPTDVNMVTTTHNSLLTRKIQEMIVKATSIVVGFVIVGSLIMGLISSI
ncbi:hypothetical protein G6F26_001535 [Rhizopus arrhizus]|nr:hypothetical protein G6F20_007722 [Rhizopus arrhizus]KAG0852785.1 hypothetical protein G6F17_007796 [Rhizopus arrhizus]KAG0868400.1 hypothetical protein G6F16_008057 [Rhizopus arrhizus]KAG0883107.1 hypothetical protein G6F15_006271 [Rhizopus arrhizus]KAG0916425.1 hypothetical protein G6F33_002408 [Rhizopus arrhizus]